MKKRVFLIVLAAFAAGSVFAQEAGQWTIGGRAGVALGFHKPSDDLENNVEYYERALSNYYGMTLSADKKMKPNGTLGIYGSYAFSPSLSLQAEMNIMVNQGLKYEMSERGSSIEYTAVYKSLDIPILIKYAFIQEPVKAGVLAGPYLSFPFGDVEEDYDYTNLPYLDVSYDSDPQGVGFGIALGGFVTYPLGPGRIVGDLRYIFDFTTLEAKVTNGNNEWETMSRRALIVTVGYEYSF